MKLNILYGPPGSGKTTAIQSLLDDRDFHYVSIGEIYRKEIEKNTSLGEELRGYVEANIVYPENVIRRVVEPYLLDIDKGETVILDGFPKHDHELKVLKELLDKYPHEIQLGKVVNLKISLDIAKERMSNRYVCALCDFHSDSTMPCSRCGSDRMNKRNDDTDHEFVDRFYVYSKNNQIIASRLGSMGFRVLEIDASNSKAITRAAIDAVIFDQEESETHIEFRNVTGLDSKVISTIDHPYVSPPIRLIDSHRILNGIHKYMPVTILNWNVSHPNARTYRYDLQVDLLFIGRSKKLFMFSDGIPFALQKPSAIGISDYDNVFKRILGALYDSSKISEQQRAYFVDNYETLRSSVLCEFMEEDGIKPEYTKLSLEAFNRLLGRREIAEFIKNRYLYYSTSTLMTSWIPYCMENIRGKRFVVTVKRAGVFGRKMLRNVDCGYSDKLLNDESFFEAHLLEIAGWIRNGSIIPSIELLYWSMEYAGIKHFGNDYGFFERYGEYLKERLHNQLTAMGDDGVNLLLLDKDYGVSLEPVGGRLISKNISSSVKSTRINSIFAFYILLGKGMKSLIEHESKKLPKKVSLDSMLES